MRRGIILTSIALAGYGYAQQTNCSPAEHANSCPAHEEKSTSSKDVKEEKTKEESTHKEEPAKKEEESTPSKDASKGEEKTQQESNSGQQSGKREEKPKSPHTFTANVSIVSDYRFRGISQTMRRPAIQGGFDYSHRCGLYLGTWASNVDGTTHFYNNTSMEWDLYGGYKGKLFPCCIPDFSFNFGMIYYYYPGGQVHNPEHTRYNTAEIYLELLYRCLSIKYWQTITNYYGINSDDTPFNWNENLADSPNGSSRGSIYIEASATFVLIRKICFRCFQGGKLSLLLHAGHQTVRHYGHLSYTDWRATLTQEFDWFNLFVTYVGTNARHAYFDVPDNAFHPKRRHLGAQGAVVGIIKTF